jgi:hypothetical protein
MLAICLCAVLAGHTPALRAETNAREVEEDNSLASTVVTPHKEWAKGYVGGPIRALFFVYTGAYDGTWEDMGTRVREVVELGERFDLQADAALFCGPSGGKWVFHGGQIGEQRAERLLEKPYQLYVLAGFGMDKLPAKIQYLILKQVAGGAGLLCCGPGAGEYMVPRRQITPLPPALADGLPVIGGKNTAEMVSAYRLGKGRGVWINDAAQSLVPFQEFNWRGLIDLDYWMLLVGRAAQWAAGREGDVTVAMPAAAGPIQASGGGDVSGIGSVTFQSRAAQVLKATVNLAVRRARDGKQMTARQDAVTLPSGKPVTVDVPSASLPAGDYFVDAVVKSPRGVEACGAGSFTVERPYGVDKVTLDRTFVERDETQTGTVTLRGTLPAGATLRLSFRDSYDRILRQQDMPLVAGQATYPFEYRPDAFATIEMRVEAQLIESGKEVDMKSAMFTVPKRRQGQMNFVIWDAPRDSLGLYAWRQLQAKGINICLIGSFGSSAQPAALRAADASLIPYSTRILDEKDENGYMKPVCWNDDPAAGKYVQGIVDNQKALREQGVFVYSLGDEGVTQGCCVSPECIAAYRRYLAAQYGAIDKLNASWGTTYASFDEVDLLDHKDNMENAALKTCFPRWYDRQAFARCNLAQFSGRFVQGYKGLDPLALTGFEGTGGFGDDYDAILGTNTFYGPYPTIGDDIIRSAYPRSMVRSNWMGYSKTGDALSDAAWRMVMKGMDSVWYWMWSGIGSWRGYLRPTLDYWPAIEDLAQEMKPVRQGLGDLLLKSKMAHSGIAVFYSVPSALASQIENSGQFVGAEATHQMWTQLTYDLGLDFRYLTSNMLKGGALDSGEFKALLLPFTQAIGPEEAAAIRRFAEAGGTVIADVRPGIYDGHCKPVTPGMLDDLFGVKRTGRGNPTDAPVAAKVTLDGHVLNLQLPKGRLDTGLEAASAQALATVDKTPVLLTNRVGKGQAILLNFQPLTAKTQDPATVATRQLLRLLYDAAGAKSAVAAASPTGDPLPLTETRVWQDGDALVFGMWRQMENAWFSPTAGTTAGAPVPTRITLPSARHVYDLRAHKYLGNVSRVDTQLRWGRASFYMALPYAIGAPKVSLSAAAPSPGQAVTASVSLKVPQGATETLAAWAEVTDPRGGQPLWGQQVVLLPGGQGQVQLCAAYNDIPGTWRLRVTELFSGQTAEASWVVK